MVEMGREERGVTSCRGASAATNVTRLTNVCKHVLLPLERLGVVLQGAKPDPHDTHQHNS